MFGLNKKLKQKNTKNANDSKNSKTDKTTMAKKASAIPDLICKSFVDGCLVLGCVHDILSGELIVSLPGIGNFGYVKLNNISSIYSDLLKNNESNKRSADSELKTLLDMYNKGDLVRCKVLNYTNNKLYLTIDPNQVNNNLNFNNLEDEMIISGAVKTKEEHGYTIDLGIDNLTGFFRTNNLKLNLPIGQCCLFKIVSKASKRAINLKLCDSNESLFYNLKTKYQFDTYLPGAQLDDCTIEKIGKNGLQLNISNQLYGYVHINHVPVSKRVGLTIKKKESEKDVVKDQSYANGDKISGTIIFINPYSRVIYLSLLPHLNDSKKEAKISRLFLNNEESLKLGQVIQNAQVQIHTHKGIYLKFKGPGSKQIIGFVPKRHLFEKNDLKNEDDEEQADDDEDATENKLKRVKKDSKNMTKEDLEKYFPLNSTVKARIYDFNLIEDIILLSCRPSVLNAEYMSYEELKVGQVLKCTVKNINSKNGGVTVKISDFLNGFIPKIHTGDIPLSEALLSKKLKLGSEIKCKIVQLNPEEKRCVLTAKKSLIKSKLDLIDSFDNLSLGMETYGVVVSIQKYGLILTFLNDIKGLLPRQEISSSLKSEEDLKDLYYLGQLIKCKVLDFDKLKNQIKLSLLMDDSKNKKSEKQEANQFESEYQIGDLIESGTILQVSQDGNYFRVKLPKGTRNGIIYKNQLSDLDSLNDILFEYYKISMKMSNLMIIQYPETSKFNKNEKNNSKTKSCLYLTLKTSLIDYYSNLVSKNEIPKSFEDLKVNTWHHGWIKKILSNGFLIDLPYNLTGFCANENLNYLDELKSSNLNGLNIGQSLLVKINKLFDDKKRFTLTVKTRYDLAQKNESELNFMIEFFKSYLKNIKRIFDQFSMLKSETLNTNGLPILTNKQFWEKLSSKIKIGSVCEVAVKNFNKSSGQIECLFLDDLVENNFDSNSNMIGYAFASQDDTEDDLNSYKQGSKLKALVLAFDPLTRAFCLTVNKKAIKTYSKNFESNFKTQNNCKQDQSIKSEILYVSQWFCIVGLKAHALGRLAFMPLFKNDFTQLNTHRALNDSTQKLNTNKYDLIDSKIKQKQVLAVSSASIASITFNSVSESLGDKLKDEANQQKSKKDDKKNKENKKFSYFYVGEIIKCLVKQTESDHLDYLIVVDDSTNIKRNKKSILRQLAILNENHTDSGPVSLKRKSDDSDEPMIVKKKLILNGDKKNKRKNDDNNDDDKDEKDHIEVVTNVKKPKTEETNENKNDSNNSFVFPWEVTDFDQFNDIISKVSNETEKEDSNSKQAIKKKENINKNKKVLDDKLIYENEEQVFDPNREPENSDDYERLITSKPNSSLLWIKYMVFYLQMAEIEKARGVAQQALKTILYKEEQERLNVWVALLNLENMYGTQTSVEQTFNKASQNCDSYKIHCHMAEIYARSNKLQDAEAIFMKMTRKYSQSPDAWIKYGIFHYKNSNCELARKLLIRSFNSLDKKDHIDMVNKFAQLEFKYGDVERAKTMYDSLLFTYPNRTDIWSVYIDMLVKHQKFDDARHIFDRIIKLGLTVKRMKFIFKKYLDFEKLHGTEDQVENVKELASKFVENNSKTSDEKNKKNETSVEENLKKNLKL